MDHSPSLTDEASHRARAREYRVLNARDESPYNRIARLAALATGAPVAIVSLLDRDGYRIIGRQGEGFPAAPHATHLANTIVTTGRSIVALDTLTEEHACCPQPVTGSSHVRFNAGVPLTTPDGLVVGALCVYDSADREPLPATQINMLRELAALAIDGLEQSRLQGSTDSQQTSAHRSLYAAYVAKSEFLASMSHELRTPLNAISGYAGLIAAADDTPAVAADQAGEILAAARHMLSLVNDVLEYSRLEAGQLPIARQRVRLRVTVEEAMRMVGVFASSRGIALASDIAWPDAIMRGDPVRMKQILLNLLTNAIKFTPRGGQVLLTLDRGAHGGARLRIRDTGVGIAAADIPKALTPFGQIVDGEERHMEGTGLGLPIAKALVERQGGSLNLASVLGQGTEVTLEMPGVRLSAPANPSLTIPVG